MSKRKCSSKLRKPGDYLLKHHESTDLSFTRKSRESTTWTIWFCGIRNSVGSPEATKKSEQFEELVLRNNK